MQDDRANIDYAGAVRAVLMRLEFSRVVCELLSSLHSTANADAPIASVLPAVAALVEQRRTLRCLLLATLCAMASRSSASQNALRDAGLLDVLSASLGRTSLVSLALLTAHGALPSVCLAPSAAPSLAAADVPTGVGALRVLERAFVEQRAIIHLLTYLMHRCPANWQRLVELGAVLQLISTVLWTSEYAALRDRARWHTAAAAAAASADSVIADTSSGSALLARNLYRASLIVDVDTTWYYLLAPIASALDDHVSIRCMCWL
jgi:hypothetical protein